MSHVTQPANSFFFSPCVLVFVQLNVFARKAAPDISKGAGEGGVWRRESEGARNRRHIGREKNREVRRKVNRGEWLIRPGGLSDVVRGWGGVFFFNSWGWRMAGVG